jgi:hypothetical protein
MSVDDTIAILGKLLKDGCGVDVTTRTADEAVPEKDGDAISLLPMSLLRTGRTSGRRPTVEARLRVLALPSGKGATHLVERMLVAVDAASGFECETKELPAETWLALGIRPQPAVVVSAPVSIELEAPDVPDVLKPTIVTVTVPALRRGILLGPDDVPLRGARVWADRNEEPARSDARGHFQVLVAEQGADHRLVVQFKDHVLTGHLPAAEEPDPTPAVIRFEEWESTT